MDQPAVQTPEEQASVTRYAVVPPAQVGELAQVSLQEGLSEEQAARRLQQVGPNAIEGREVTRWRLVRRQLANALTILLLGAAALSLALGELADGIIILVLVLLNGVLGFWQEYRAARALEELRRLIQVQARVKRGGQQRVIPAREIVPGDVVLAQAGDIVPADVRLVDAQSLAVNEAALTGEAMPVSKTAEAIPEIRGKPTRVPNTLFTGTTIVSGRGEGVAVATGTRTYFGQTASLLRGLEQPGPFQQELNRFADVLLVVGVVALVAIVAANTALGRGLLNSLIFGLALIAGIVPEALPAVTAITLSLGAAELARQNVVVKRLSALQDLSSVTVLCSDKTGTLTRGMMTVETVWGAPETLRDAVLATTYPQRGENTIYDAIIDYAARRGALGEGSQAKPLLKRMPFDPSRKRASVVLRRDGAAQLIALGAPPSVMEVCSDYSRAGSREEAEAQLGAMADRALRVVAVATRDLPTREDYTPADEQELSFLGLIGMGDPIRPGVPQAIARARRLDVDVKVLTGDNVRTAQAVARQLGLTSDGAVVVTGEELRQRQASPQQLCATQIFAELIPQDKYLIVQGLERAGEAVAVTGDGVNDAPALRAATVGVAMASGTAVAKEAGDLILVQDDFGSLVDGVGKGREILANLSKYLLYTMPGNYSILITMFVASLVLPFLPLLPAQVLLLAVITDLPMLAISTDTVDPEELVRPERLDIGRLVALAGVLGVLGALFNFGLMAFLRQRPEALFHTALLYELALTTFFLAPVVRSRRPLWRERSMSRVLLGALAMGMAFFVFLVTANTPLTAFLGLVVLPGGLNLAIVGYSLLYALVAEAASEVYYRVRPGSGGAAAKSRCRTGGQEGPDP